MNELEDWYQVPVLFLPVFPEGRAYSSSQIYLPFPKGLQFPVLALALEVIPPSGMFFSLSKLPPLRCKLHATSCMQLSLFSLFGSAAFLLIFSVNNSCIYIFTPYLPYEFQTVYCMSWVGYLIDSTLTHPHPPSHSVEPAPLAVSLTSAKGSSIFPGSQAKTFIIKLGLCLVLLVSILWNRPRYVQHGDTMLYCCHQGSSQGQWPPLLLFPLPVFSRRAAKVTPCKKRIKSHQSPAKSPAVTDIPIRCPGPGWPGFTNPQAFLTLVPNTLLLF